MNKYYQPRIIYTTKQEERKALEQDVNALQAKRQGKTQVEHAKKDVDNLLKRYGIKE